MIDFIFVINLLNLSKANKKNFCILALFIFSYFIIDFYGVFFFSFCYFFSLIESILLMPVPNRAH